MKHKVIQIIVFFSVIFISQKICAQPISVISFDIVFLRSEVSESRSGPIINGRATQVITYYKKDYYSLKFTIKTNENIEIPLDIKLTSSKKKEKIYRLEENIISLKKDEYYDYNVEIILGETGWYKYEMGDFSINEKGTISNTVFYESSIYIRK